MNRKRVEARLDPCGTPEDYGTSGRESTCNLNTLGTVIEIGFDS